MHADSLTRAIRVDLRQFVQRVVARTRRDYLLACERVVERESALAPEHQHADGPRRSLLRARSVAGHRLARAEALHRKVAASKVSTTPHDILLELFGLLRDSPGADELLLSPVVLDACACEETVSVR